MNSQLELGSLHVNAFAAELAPGTSSENIWEAISATIEIEQNDDQRNVGDGQ
jgi:hypothetical protein